MSTTYYRNPNDTVIAGIASGIAQSLNLSTILVRLIFILLLISGPGILIYIILWVIIPKGQIQNNNTMENSENKPKRNEGNIVAGLILIGLGILFLIIRYFPEIDFKDLWPYILIVVGGFLLFRGFRSN